MTLFKETKNKMKRILFIIGVGVSLMGSVTEVHATENTRLFAQSIGLSGTISASSVNIRTQPDLSSDVITKLGNTNVQVLGRYDDWYQISYGNNTAWISSSYVDVKFADKIPVVAVNGQEIIDYSLNFLGTPYVWGGTNLNNGVDCSGFTQQVYDAFDIDISRVSYQQAKDGPTISKNELQTGDLVFFDTSNNGGISHVGIYIDDDNFIHSDSTNGVMVSSLNNSYYSQNYVKGIRVMY